MSLNSEAASVIAGLGSESFTSVGLPAGLMSHGATSSLYLAEPSRDLSSVRPLSS